MEASSGKRLLKNASALARMVPHWARSASPRELLLERGTPEGQGKGPRPTCQGEQIGRGCSSALSRQFLAITDPTKRVYSKRASGENTKSPQQQDLPVALDALNALIAAAAMSSVPGPPPTTASLAATVQ